MLAAAADICSAEEVAFLELLLNDVSARGGRVWWGNGKTAGFTGWYLIAGKDTPVWNVNIGDAAGRGKFYFTLAEFRTRHAGDRSQVLAADIAAIASLSVQVERVKQRNWRGWAGLAMSQATSWQEKIVTTISTATSSR